jgi:hypothetical protein
LFPPGAGQPTQAGSAGTNELTTIHLPSSLCAKQFPIVLESGSPQLTAWIRVSAWRGLSAFSTLSRWAARAWQTRGRTACRSSTTSTVSERTS